MKHLNKFNEGWFSKDAALRKGVTEKETAPVSDKKADAQTVKNRMQEIEKQPISINVTQDASGKMEQTSEEVVSQIKAELDKIGLPYSDVVANDKGSTYFVVTKDGQQHEILKLLKTGGALVKPVLTKGKWINHLIKTQPQDLYNFVDAELAALSTDTKADIERRSGESSTDFINRLFENNYFTEVDGKQLFSLTQGRWGIVVDISGIKIPFYQSTSGTDTKVAGQWYPFFGDQGNWVIKGNSDNSNLGYGFKAIQDVQAFLNKNIKEKDAIALSDLVPTEINQNKEDLRKLKESQIKGNDNLSISKEATAKRLSKLMGYSLEEAKKVKSDTELFKLASKKVFAELAAQLHSSLM